MKTPKNKTKSGGNPSWGKGIGTLFLVVNFIQHYRIYRIFQFLPKLVPLTLGRLLGVGMNGKNRVLKKKITATILTFFPNMPPNRVKKVVNASIIHMGQMLIDLMFLFPNITPSNIDTFLSYSNLERLDKALAIGKGVLLPTVHVGNFFNIVAALVGHSKKYPLVVIANMGNQKVFEELIAKYHLKHLYMIGRDDFPKLEQKLITHLNANHCILIMYDMGKKSQLRTPFCLDKYRFLVHTPQSIFALHRKTGAPILPVVAKPKNSVIYHDIIFCDPSPLEQISQRFSSQNIVNTQNTFLKKQFYGELATKLNQMLFPYLAAYPHVWEEVHNFTVSRSGDEIYFPINITLQSFISQCHSKLLWILENSYEPNRNDELIKQILNVDFPRMYNAIREPNRVLFNHKTRIRLNNLSGLQSFQKLSRILQNMMKKCAEIDADFFLTKLIDQWQFLFSNSIQ